MFTFVYENVRDGEAIVSFLAERGFTEIDDKHFVFTFVVLFESFLRKKFLSGENGKTDFIKDTAFLRESLILLGPQLCRVVSASLKTTSDGVLPTRLCASALDLILTLSTAFCTNVNNSLVVENDDTRNLEGLQCVVRLFSFVAQTQERIFSKTRPLYASGLSKAVQVAGASINGISHIEPLFAQYMSLTEKVSVHGDVVHEIQRIIGLFGNSSKRALGLACLCLFLGRSPKIQKGVGNMILTQIKEIVITDSELGVRVIEVFLPLENLVEEEAIVIKPLLGLLSEGVATDPILGLVGRLAVRHREEVVDHLFSMLTSADPAVREIGARALSPVLRSAKSNKPLSELIVECTISNITSNITSLGDEISASDILVTLGEPAYTLTCLVPFLKSTPDESTHSSIESTIVEIMKKSVSELEPEEKVRSAIMSYADAMRMKKDQSTFVISPALSPADLCKLHAAGKEDFSEDLLKLVPMWCHGLCGTGILGAAEKLFAAPGDTALVQFFRALAPHFQEGDIQLLFVPLVVAKLESQKKLTEEMLDSPYGKEQVTALLFERLSPLLALKMTMGHCTVPIQDKVARERLVSALIERITSLLEFDEVRRVAAEAIALLKPPEVVFEKLLGNFLSLSETVLAASGRDDDTQIVLRAVLYAIGSVVKDFSGESDIPLLWNKLEERLMVLLEKKAVFLAPALVGTIYDTLGFLLLKSKDYAQRVGKIIDEICSDEKTGSERSMVLSAVLTSVAKGLNEGKDEFAQLVVPKVIAKVSDAPNDYLMNVNKLTFLCASKKNSFFLYSFCL